MSLREVTKAEVERVFRARVYESGYTEWEAIRRIQALLELGLTEREVALVLAVTGAVVCNAYCNHPPD
jgi:hypothetical protein